MQKKLIALAIAGLSGAAFAQSNVTVYGVADVGVEWAKADVVAPGATGNHTGNKFRVQSGQSAGSRLGFKGEEALGNGLSAIFTLEMGIALDNGQTSQHGTVGGNVGGVNVNGAGVGYTTTAAGAAGNGIFSRQAFAGLKGGFGQVTIGRQYTPFYLVKANADAFALGLGGTYNNLMAVVPGNADRLNNMAMYLSPNFGGVTLGAAYSTGDENNVKTATGSLSEKSGRTWGLYGQFANGPIYVGAAYHDVYASSTTVLAAPLSENAHGKGYLLGASFDFGAAKVFASYGSGKTTQAGATGINGSTTAKGNLWNVGVKVPFGKSAVLASYTRANDKLNYATGINQVDANQWGVGYTYDLSKRTNLYASYARIDNKNPGSVGGGGTYDVNGALTQGLNGAAGVNPSSLMLGVKHSF